MTKFIRAGAEMERLSVKWGAVGQHAVNAAEMGNQQPARVE